MYLTLNIIVVIIKYLYILILVIIYAAHRDFIALKVHTFEFIPFHNCYGIVLVYFTDILIIVFNFVKVFLFFQNVLGYIFSYIL